MSEQGTGAEARELELGQVLEALPEGGLFRSGAGWKYSPRPLAISRAVAKSLEGLGHVLAKFQDACEQLYTQSWRGEAPRWISETLDAGKPGWLIDLQRQPALRGAMPRVIRPDLLLTEGGFALSEIDSVPGGMGITAWLAKLYAAAGWDVTGGADGLLGGFERLYPEGVDILVSAEASDYRAELEWFCRELNLRAVASGTRREFRCVSAEGYEPVAGSRPGSVRPAYRFFELFDLDAVPGSRELCEAAAAGRVELSAPPKPVHEEKLWLALLHTPSLRRHWKKLMRASHLARMLEIVPRGWVVDPAPIPYNAALPGLDAYDWSDVASFGQKQRQFVLKISGFDPDCWGARGVFVGHDLPQQEWKVAVEAALASFDRNPWIMQEFARTEVVRHTVFGPDGSVEPAPGRVRLCPWYIREDGRTWLAGALATIAPADKKKIHGMKDAILVPVTRAAK